MTYLKSVTSALVVLISLSAGCDNRAENPRKISYKIVSTIPHDPNAYTQGLQIDGDRLLESTGMYGASSVREVDPKTGEVKKKRPLSNQVFGEGLTLHDGKLWVLTWKEKTVYVLDPTTFKLQSQFSYEGEGWGLTSDGKYLIMSNGSDILNFRDPKNFAVVKSIEVKFQGKPVRQLNELEFIDGEIFANIYMTDRIVRIDPKTGSVTGWLDLGVLRSHLSRPNRAEAFNGIAHDEKTGRLLVTGKYWPQMFELELGEE
jgi:glutaminyl-peptide cyclotransferase